MRSDQVRTLLLLVVCVLLLIPAAAPSADESEFVIPEAVRRQVSRILEQAEEDPAFGGAAG